VKELTAADILFNKTKIVATVGPASNTKEKLAQLIIAGVDVFRLNFSHGTHEGHKQVIQFVKELNDEMGTTVALLQDLQGPKIRVEEVEDGVELVPGQEFTITIDNVKGNAIKASTSYQSLPNDVMPGDMILIDDGKIELKVRSKTSREVVTEVVYGGILKSRKGINLPDTHVTAPSLTEKDEKDLRFGLENEVDWVALSFVRTADDVRYIKSIIKEHNSTMKVISKIEKPQAVANIDEIIEESDGLMVARGDLGVEMMMEEVPLIQKKLVQKCNQANKPVIVATQMLESMIENPRPTRAEANDVANAVIDGADAVMLSAESASGAYPVLAVKSMDRIIGMVERDVHTIYFKNQPIHPKDDLYHTDSLISSACILASKVHAKAICALTSSGYTALQISKHRPKSNIFIFTRRRHLMRQLNLLWGTRTMYFERHKNLDDTVEEIQEHLVKDGYLKSGDTFVLVAAIPLDDRGPSNMMKLCMIP
jgi:pyruvate kinase